MKIQEADAKSLLIAQGLPVPGYEVARTTADARAAAERILAGGAEQVVIKAQVLVGGRGKAGGVRLAATPAEAEAVAGAILGMDIKGITVRKVLVAPARRHRPRVLPRGGPRPGSPADPPHGLGRGRRRDRAGRRRAARGDRQDPRSSAPRTPRLAGPPDGVRPRSRGPPEGGRRHRQGSRPDDDGLRRGPRRGEPARHRPLRRCRRVGDLHASSASMRRSPSTTRPSDATRGWRSSATSTRRTRPTSPPGSRASASSSSTARSAAWSTGPASP